MAVKRSLVPALERAVEILDLVAEEPGTLGISAIARRLDLPKSSVANICGVLIDTGMLRLHSDGYRLGAHLAQLGASYLSGVDYVRLFHECCAGLDVAVSETVQLAMLNDDLDVVYLARRDGVYPVRLASTPGKALPATCTATGKAMLARLTDDALAARLDDAEFPALTRNSITSRTAFVKEVADIRRQGFAVDREEVIEGVICVAVAVPGSGPGGDSMAMSVTLLAPRASRSLLEQIAAELHGATQEFSVGLGRRVGSGQATG